MFSKVCKKFQFEQKYRSFFLTFNTSIKKNRIQRWLQIRWIQTKLKIQLKKGKVKKSIFPSLLFCSSSTSSKSALNSVFSDLTFLNFCKIIFFPHNSALKTREKNFFQHPSYSWILQPSTGPDKQVVKTVVPYCILLLLLYPSTCFKFEWWGWDIRGQHLHKNAAENISNATLKTNLFLLCLLCNI